jgi:hypothetical protein
MSLIEAIVFIAYCSFFDGVRDATIDRDWWVRHIWKWLAFYPPLAWILFRYVHGDWIWLLVAASAWVLWRVGMRAGGKHWVSMWIVWLKNFVGYKLRWWG